MLIQCISGWQMRKVGGGLVLSSFLALAGPALAVEPSNMVFTDFIAAMNKGEVRKVVFDGVTPTSCVATLKTGDIVLVKDGK